MEPCVRYGLKERSGRLHSKHRLFCESEDGQARLEHCQWSVTQWPSWFKEKGKEGGVVNVGTR